MPQENEIQKNSMQANVSYTQAFEQALALQQQQKWDASIEAYQKLLDQSVKEMSASQASVIYHNMSSSAYEKGDLLKAYIWSKKSLSISPSNQIAQKSFAEYSKKVETPIIAHQITNLDYFKSVISKAPLDTWLILSLILIFSTTWLALKNTLTRKKNMLANNFSALPKWPLFLIAAICLLVISTTYIAHQEASTPRALVIAEKAQVQTAPGENMPVIFEAQAGLEIEVLKFEQGYFQVRYPGAFSGWIKKEQLEILSLAFEQKM